MQSRTTHRRRFDSENSVPWKASGTISFSFAPMDTPWIGAACAHVFPRGIESVPAAPRAIAEGIAGGGAASLRVGQVLGAHRPEGVKVRDRPRPDLKRVILSRSDRAIPVGAWEIQQGTRQNEKVSPLTVVDDHRELFLVL